MSATVVFNRKKATDENGYVGILYKDLNRPRGMQTKKISLEFKISKLTSINSLIRNSSCLKRLLLLIIS